MLNTGKLAGQTIFITGASRGIGKAIALKAAKDGANIVIAAKTAEPHPKLPGTIYSAAKEMEAAGAKCLPCVVDVRDESQVQKAIDGAVSQFGGIDIVVNNASAISLTSTPDTQMKRYDLMQSINTRGTYLVSKLCLEHLKKSRNPHILTLSPPLNMLPQWFKNHTAYSISKYGMSMCVLGMSEEFKSDGIAVNALWPKTMIITAAAQMLGGNEVAKYCRKPEILADAAYAIFNKDSRSFTGNFVIDEHLLKQEGITDFDQYAMEPGNPLIPDLFLSKEDWESFGEESIKLTLQMAQASSEESSGSSSSSPNLLSDVFGKIKTRIDEKMVKSTNGVYKFQIKGEQEEVWYVDLKNSPGDVGKGDPPSGKADVIFTTDLQSFLKILSGEMKATTAFMSGKLRLKGDMSLAMKLEKLFGAMKAKL